MKCIVFQIFEFNNIKLYAKNEQINLCFHWRVRYAKNWAVGKQMKMIAFIILLSADCSSQSTLLSNVYTVILNSLCNISLFTVKKIYFRSC